MYTLHWAQGRGCKRPLAFSEYFRESKIPCSPEHHLIPKRAEIGFSDSMGGFWSRVLVLVDIYGLGGGGSALRRDPDDVDGGIFF